MDGASVRRLFSGDESGRRTMVNQRLLAKPCELSTQRLYFLFQGGKAGTKGG